MNGICVMSRNALRKAARIRDPRMDLGHRITLLLLADRSDRKGRILVENDAKLYGEMAHETNAVMARLRGDPLVHFGVDNARVTRVIEAMMEADDE